MLFQEILDIYEIIKYEPTEDMNKNKQSIDGVCLFEVIVCQ